MVAGGLNRAERAVAEVILADIDAATRMTARALAGRAGVSEPTVIRFARRLGCDGAADLKRRLSRDFATARMFVLSDHTKVATGADAVTQQVYEATAQALAHSFAQRDPAALERSARAIDAAARVFCMGTGGSSANLAQEAENRLFRLGVPTQAIIDEYQQRIAAAGCTAADVVLLFSVTGQPRSLCDAAALAREGGAAVIAVTRPESALAAGASILLPLVIPDNDRQHEIPNRSRYGQLYILDCLATLVATRRLKRAAPKLQRARRALLELHGPTDQQPIGD